MVQKPYHFRPAEDIRQIAGRAASSTVSDECGETLPFPVRTADGVALLVLYYKVFGGAGPQEIKPPHYAMYLDGTTGQVLRFTATSADSLGIRVPPVPVEGVTGPRDIDGSQRLARRDRLLAIAAQVWSGYANDDRTPATCALAGEYWTLFTGLELPSVAPFYVDASPDFFQYVRNCGKAP